MIRSALSVSLSLCLSVDLLLVALIIKARFPRFMVKNRLLCNKNWFSWRRIAKTALHARSLCKGSAFPSFQTIFDKKQQFFDPWELQNPRNFTSRGPKMESKSIPERRSFPKTPSELHFSKNQWFLDPQMESQIVKNHPQNWFAKLLDF